MGNLLPLETSVKLQNPACQNSELNALAVPEIKAEKMPNWRKQACRFFVVVAVSFLAAQLIILFGSIDQITDEQKSNDGHVLDKKVEDIHGKAEIANRSDLFRQLDSFQHQDGEGMDYCWPTLWPTHRPFITAYIDSQ